MADISPLDLYCALMEEIKLRVSFIEHIRERESPVPIITKECCYLQLRMIHELMAIACIAIQSRHVNIGRLEKQWSANEIMPQIEKLNPAFFPKAIQLKRSTEGHLVGIIEPADQPLTKATFLKTYGRLGDLLHRGTLKKITSAMPASPVDLSDVLEMTTAIKTLLGLHSIHAPDNTRYYCEMHHRPENNKVALFSGLFFPDPK